MAEARVLRVVRLPHAGGLALPAYGSAGAAGMDVLAAVDGAVLLAPGARAAIPTGLCVEVPAGHELQVRARSGLALTHGIAVLNAPGTIDCDYRGEVRVLLANLGEHEFAVTRGLRIAQLVLAPYVRCEWLEAETLAESVRGAGGFGSTGRF